MDNANDKQQLLRAIPKVDEFFHWLVSGEVQVEVKIIASHNGDRGEFPLLDPSLERDC